MAEEETEAVEQDETAVDETPSETEEVEETPSEVAASVPSIEGPERSESSLAPVIDIATLLKPIEGENNAGEYLRYDGVYDEISEARRADEILDQGAWQSELKVADYREVVKLATPVIETRSKDLQISAWFCEALSAEHGFAGARDGVRLLHLMLTHFWDGLFPEIDEGDEEGRANALAWVDEAIADNLKKAPITADGWGYNGFVDSKKFDIPENLEGMSSDDQLRYNALKEQADRENRATATQWKRAVSNTRREFCEAIDLTLSECLEEYKLLNQAIEEKFDRNQAPSLPSIRKAIEEIRNEFDKILNLKRIEEPDESDAAEENEVNGESSTDGGVRVAKGAVQNRADALKRLSEISAFFKKTEPHSPVSYLLNRAVAWGNMPLETWLEDVIKDQNILAQLKQTLGFNTSADSSNESSGDGGSQDEKPKPDFLPLQ